VAIACDQISYGRAQLRAYARDNNRRLSDVARNLIDGLVGMDHARLMVGAALS